MDNEEQPKKTNKPIGRQLNVKSTKSTKVRVPEGIPTTMAVLLVLGMGIISFVAGTRVDEYALLDGAFNTSTTENGELPENLDFTTVERVYDKLRKSFDGPLTEEQLLDGLKVGLAESTGDPYTTYLNSEQATQFKDDLNGTFSGIGAEIGKEGEFVIIVAPLKGFPAQVAGLQSGDIILTVDGEDATGWSVEEAVLNIRGERGTDVVLEVFRNQERLEFTITRDTITIPSVEHEVVDGVGVLYVYRFAEDTVTLVGQAADEFVEKNVEGIVLDLRNNSGGFLGAGVDVAGFWLDSKVVVEQREDEGRRVTEVYRSKPGAPLGDIPTVVLINQGSASASEIVAGALVDYEKATLMGTTSYGKGSVQALEDIRDGGVLKVTIARWFTPLGTNIDGDGLEPEVVVEYEPVESDPEADNQLDAAIEFLQ